MTSYKFGSDSETGTVKAESLQDAMGKVVESLGLDDEEVVTDGGYAWVEDSETGERLQVGTM